MSETTPKSSTSSVTTPTAPVGALDCHRVTDSATQTPEVALTVGDIFKVECAAPPSLLNLSQLKFETEKPYQLQIINTELPSNAGSPTANPTANPSTNSTPNNSPTNGTSINNPSSSHPLSDPATSSQATSSSAPSTQPSVELQPDGRLVIQVTSYQVGEFNSKNTFLTDGVNRIPIKGIQFKVQSVIDPKNPPKGPYGPFGGSVLMLPPFYFWTGLGLIIFMFLWAGFRILRRWQKKRLIEGLKKHDSRLSPSTQLHVRFRQLERQRFLEESQLKKLIPEVEDILRIFIIRQFKIPAYDWSDRLILNDFQQRFAFLGKELRKELGVLLRETHKTRDWSDPQSKDVEQLVRKIKRWADQVERLMGTHQRKEKAGL